jgi:formylmethanofuran dehydrogenase subunit E
MKVIKTEIEAKSKQLQGHWKVVYETLKPQYSKELEVELAKTLREEIDWEIVMDSLKYLGYTHIKMSWPVRMDETQAHEIKEWCRENLTEHYNGRGQDWLFKSEEDAVMFRLRFGA